MNLQEIFNKVATHLLTQKVKATVSINCVSGSGCVYHGPKGRACAIGCLISNKDYKPSFETIYFPGLTTDTIQENSDNTNEFIKAIENTIGRGLHGEVYFLLLDLQAIHDKMSAESWKERLATCATRHNLNFF